MTNRTELLEAALDSLTEGVVLVDLEGRIAFWNRAAEAITGHRGSELIGHPARDGWESMIVAGGRLLGEQMIAVSAPGHGSVVLARHRIGHVFPAMARGMVLRDELGARIGLGVIFHPADSMDALPHGELVDDSFAGKNQEELEERLVALHEDFAQGEAPLGVLWITVDQARDLRGTHGARACEAMLERVERVLAGGLMPAEEIGRWGEDEFLVLSHVRNAPMLAARAQMLGGLARTTDFRWWGDRVSVTVSIGAAQAERGDSPAKLLERAQAAMRACMYAGGNQNQCAHGRNACSPS